MPYITTLHYNDKITLTGISLKVYDYIVNDANDWAVKTMGNPRFFQRVVTVSLETMKIVNSLPKLDI
ncbi:MAG: hypothetical protein PHH47_06425 [Gallionella sp.]|nr:hypothetical protein [Gallionella sp.]MDD4946818.1 hypothetical protein [Gallionella sp.]